MTDENPPADEQSVALAALPEASPEPETQAERSRSAPEVTMSAAEIARMRERLRRKFH